MFTDRSDGSVAFADEDQKSVWTGLIMVMTHSDGFDSTDVFSVPTAT